MDHYQVLGVPPHARRDEIRAAYLRLMREHHPDHRPDDPEAAEVARRANAAWDVLGDGRSRASYDRVRASRLGAAPVAVPRREAPATVAYSEDRADYRAAFSRACLRVGVAVCVLGLVLLTALSV